MLALVIGALIATQSAAQAPPRRDTRTWYQAYAEGKRAFDQKNWQAAIDSLEASKRAGAPKPGRKIPFYGDVYDDFLPDYYLGMAYLNLKQYVQADRAFAAVRASGVIGPRDREYAQLESQSNAARGGLQTQNVAQTAQNTPAPPGTNAAAPTAAGNAPSAPANLAIQQTAPANAAVLPGAQRPLVPAGLPQTQAPTQVQPPAARGNANANANVSRPTGKAPQTTRPNVPPAPVQANSAPPPDPAASEREAIRLYLSGQYADASDQVVRAGTRATPRALFYMACSQTALAILGQGGSAAIDEAKTLVARAGNPDQFAADRRYVSPRVLRMLGLNP
jgi:hypothetical protein